MKFHKYYFGFYEHYEILDDNHVECVIKDITSNKYGNPQLDRVD